MSLTAEDLGAPATVRRTDLRDGQGRPVCGAEKRNGDPCMAYAGQGTDHPGYGACKNHAGSTQNGERRAAKEMVAARVNEMIASGEIDYISPEQALMADVTRAALSVAYWDNLLQEEDVDVTTPRGQVLVQQWNEQRRLLHQAAKLVINSGIAKRQVEIAEMQATVLMQALLIVITSPELNLTPQQQSLARSLMGAKLRSLAAGSVVEV